MTTEAQYKQGLSAEVLASYPQSVELIYEFWIPRSYERADLAVVGTMMMGFEIKSGRDSLKRLPRQISAYSRIFDHCHAVLAPRHVQAALEMLPPWWGVQVADDDMRFRSLRKAELNAGVDPETLVRLLWRNEAYAALCDLGQRPDSGAGRFHMWELLVSVLDLEHLKRVVRDSLLRRDPSKARMPSRRFDFTQ